MLNCSSSSDAEGVLNMSRVNRGLLGCWASKEGLLVPVASWASDEDMAAVVVFLIR